MPCGSPEGTSADGRKGASAFHIRTSLALHLQLDGVDAGAYVADPEGVGGEVAAEVEDLVEEVHLEAELFT